MLFYENFWQRTPSGSKLPPKMVERCPKMTQKGPELKSPILVRFSSALRQIGGFRPCWVHFWTLIWSRITFSVRIRCIQRVFWAWIDPNLKWAVFGQISSTQRGKRVSQGRWVHFWYLLLSIITFCIRIYRIRNVFLAPKTSPPSKEN